MGGYTARRAWHGPADVLNMLSLEERLSRLRKWCVKHEPQGVIRKA